MIWIAIVFIVVTVVQLYFWVVQLDVVTRVQKADISSKSPSKLPSASLVIAIKDEAYNIRKNIKLWIEQDYPDLEIVIINDHSTDGSRDILYKVGSPKIKVYDLPTDQSGKKAALAYGISLAQGEWIITTDADCTPKSSNWIKRMIYHNADVDLIIGYSPYRKAEGLVSLLVSYEAWYIALQYLSALLLGRPYMSVGRNVAFKKSLFEKVGGYKSHTDILSGDDDLFLQDAKSQGRISYTIHPDTWVWTDPPQNWSSYVQQKRRHLSTAPRYEQRDKIILMSFYITQLLFFISIIFLATHYPWILSFLLIRCVWIGWVAYRSKEVLFLPVKWWLTPVMDFCLCVFYLLLSPFMTKSPSRW